jgi:hypothetical protein
MQLIRSMVPALLAGTFVLSLPLQAVAVTNVSRTIPAGTKLHCVLGQNIDSRKLAAGTTFTLLIDEPTLPALDGAKIYGDVTDVAQPHGIDRARIGFVFTHVTFKDGKREPIHAQVLSKYVTQNNSADVKREADKFLLPRLPVGTVTPGPIAFQVTFSPGAAPSITPPPSGNTGGYVYAAKSNENIVIPAGTAVTIQLTSSLTAQ